MALPVKHTFNEEFVSGGSPSIGGTPGTAAYLNVPFRCVVTKVALVAQGAITTADCVIAVSVNGGSAITALAFTLPVASAAAGQIVTAIPTSPVYFNEDDVVKFAPTGASGATIGGLFGMWLREA